MSLDTANKWLMLMHGIIDAAAPQKVFGVAGFFYYAANC
jgi:hypothetical protein